MYKLDRDSYYIKILVEENKENEMYRLVFKPFYVNKEGVKERRNKTKIFFIENEEREVIQQLMENVIDFLYIESKTDELFKYSKLKFNHKAIMLLRSHSTLIGCHSSIIELLSLFTHNGILNKKDIKEEEI